MDRIETPGNEGDGSWLHELRDELLDEIILDHVVMRSAVNLVCPRCDRRVADMRWEPEAPGNFWLSNENYISGRARYKSEVTVIASLDGTALKARIKCKCGFDFRPSFDRLIEIYVRSIEGGRDRVQLPWSAAG